MRRLILGAMLTLPCCGAITRVQQIVPTAKCVSGPCTVNIAATEAGNLGVLMSLNEFAGNNVRIVDVTGGGAWVANGACKTQGSGDGGVVDIAYNLSLAAGTTSLTVNLNYFGSGGNYLMFVEYRPSSPGAPWSLDGACGHITGTSINPTTPTMVTSGANSVIVAVVGTASMNYGNTNVSGAGWTTPYTMFWPGPALPNTRGCGDDALNVPPGTYQATFNNGYSKNFASSALAFREMLMPTVNKRRGIR
jgi:hypothetical protein